MKKITSKHFELRKTIEGTNTSVDFIPKVKTKTAPQIVESFLDDDLNVQHILDNGNTISDSNYLLHWGKPKGVPNWDAKPEKVNLNKFALK